MLDKTMRRKYIKSLNMRTKLRTEFDHTPFFVKRGVSRETDLVDCLEVVFEVRHEVVLGLRSHCHAHSTQVGPGVAGNQRVTDATHQSGEAQQGLSVFTVREKAVALQDGRLHVAMG